MSIPPVPPESAPDDPAGALQAFTDAGWEIGPGWVAARTVGSRTRVIAARSAAELLDRLLAAEVDEPEGELPG